MLIWTILNVFPLQQWLFKHTSILRAAQATDDKMAHKQCMVDIKGYKQTLRIYISI